MEQDWALVFASTQPHLVELAKSLLEHNDIICVLKNNQDSFYKAFGDIELYVMRDDLIKAKYILEKPHE
jgi:hypothetical protein